MRSSVERAIWPQGAPWRGNSGGVTRLTVLSVSEYTIVGIVYGNVQVTGGRAMGRRARKRVARRLCWRVVWRRAVPTNDANLPWERRGVRSSHGRRRALKGWLPEGAKWESGAEGEGNGAT